MTDAALTLDLAGSWRLRPDNDAQTLTMPVPGDVHSALEVAGIIPDPYLCDNEGRVQWVAHQDWHLTRNFTIEAGDVAGYWYLDLDFVDTVATVLVNGQIVLQSDNCFRRYRPIVSHAIVAGENTIEIILHSSVEAGKAIHDALPFPVPWLAMNCPIPYGNMLRKPQCHFGWDWNIALAPLGLYGTVALKRLGWTRIEHVTTKQIHHQNGMVELEVTAEVFACDPAIVAIYFDLDGERVRLDCAVNAGETTIRHRFEIENPRLWWPAGSGGQPLYPLSVEVAGEKVTRMIGLRSVELLTDKDEAGSRFAFKVNGVEIFCRGANWIPADALFSRTSPEKTQDLLFSAIQANMNMIRIWGGGFYEHDWFYDACDRLGLLVWQDFMFACNLYPSTPAYLANVSAEVDYQVKRLSHHASIVLWCGDNELVGALNWFEVSRKDRDRYLVSYDRLNRTIGTALRHADDNALWWPSSPSCGPLNFGDAWHADGSGDMHFWSVWHENKSFDHYRSVKPRFCSEFGFQSYPSMQVVAQFSDKKDMNIASPVMEVHQKNPGGNERIAATMFRYFRFPKDFGNFVYLSQVQQGLAIKTAVDYWRSLKPHTMGTIYWQLNDTWPVASWASLDYGGNWKLLHYLATRFFQPVCVAAIPSADAKTLSFSGVNDTLNSVDVALDIFVATLDGKRRLLHSFGGAIAPERALSLVNIDMAVIAPDSLIFWRFEASNGMTGEGHHVPFPYKALDLVSPGLEAGIVARSDGVFDINLSAKALALFVTVETDIAGRFSDNGFDMLAGDKRTITFVPKVPTTIAPTFLLRDLFSCYSEE